VNPPAGDEIPELIFDWQPPPDRRLMLLGLVVASLFGHAFCFYLFQIVYPPTVAILPPPARISLISPSSEAGRNLLRWAQAEDPALAFATQRPAESRLRALPKVEHVPSYLAHEPAIQQLPPLTMGLHSPSAEPPGPVRIVRQKSRLLPDKFYTQISFSNELATLGVAMYPQTKFTATTREPPQALQFRVAVNARGEIQHCFAMNSSGDAALDEQARHYVGLCHFAPKSTTESGSEQSLTWGAATIEWGSDIERPQTKSGTATNAP
jgi:hypothetical protein